MRCHQAPKDQATKMVEAYDVFSVVCGFRERQWRLEQWQRQWQGQEHAQWASLLDSVAHLRERVARDARLPAPRWAGALGDAAPEWARAAEAGAALGSPRAAARAICPPS